MKVSVTGRSAAAPGSWHVEPHRRRAAVHPQAAMGDISHTLGALDQGGVTTGAAPIRAVLRPPRADSLRAAAANELPALPEGMRGARPRVSTRPTSIRPAGGRQPGGTNHDSCGAATRRMALGTKDARHMPDRSRRS